MINKIQLATALITLLVEAIAKFLEISPDELRAALIKDPTICGKSTDEVLATIGTNLPEKE